MMSLETLSLDEIKHDASVFIIGGNKSGRTTLIHRILTHHSDITRGTYLNEYSDDALRILYKQQDSLRYSIERRAYLILDNCMEDNTWPQNRLIRNAFSFNRSMGLLFMQSTDIAKARAIPPVLKAELDWICLLNEPDMTKRRHLFDRFIDGLCSFEQFCVWMDSYTVNYGSLIIDSIANSIKRFTIY